MLETRSAVYKMLKVSANEDRRINHWPAPFNSRVASITPYADRTDFHNSVRRACAAKNLSPRISKMIVVGDVAVGKTCLVNRFCHKSFNDNYKATIGVDFEVERFDVLDTPFNLQIWDTAGQERFKCIAASYYRGASVIAIVFDLASPLSLSHCREWLNEATRSNPDRSCLIFLVGTKRDLLSNQVYSVIEKRAIAVAETMRAEYWAVSAKTGDGVDRFFARLAAMSFDTSVVGELTSAAARDTLAVGANLASASRLDRSDKLGRTSFERRWFCSIL